jgi:hypothetical protein
MEHRMSKLSRRNLVATAAALPALAVPAMPAVAGAAMKPATALSKFADQICLEYDRLGTLDRDLEDSDWKLFNSLSEQLWQTRSTSINDLAAKARVLDKMCRIDGEVRPIPARSTAGSIYIVISGPYSMRSYTSTAECRMNGGTPLNSLELSQDCLWGLVLARLHLTLMLSVPKA